MKKIILPAIILFGLSATSAFAQEKPKENTETTEGIRAEVPDSNEEMELTPKQRKIVERKMRELQRKEKRLDFRGRESNDLRLEPQITE
ncbi:MAG: hypothetical protein JJU02_00160 [Cryomorphaceae bacterium]|nr:hypothetical protein [Cryomorphaceae bacterium]